MTGISAHSRRVLCIWRPTRLYPRYEDTFLGCRPDEARKSASAVKRALAYPAHLATYRVNPKGFGHALACLEEDLPEGPECDVIMVDASPEDVSSAKASPRFRNVRAISKATERDVLRAEHANRSYDAVILLYGDAVGIGWSSTERAVRKFGVPITVLNGRSRNFPLDRSTRIAQAWRRVCERAWGAELLFSAAFLVSLPVVLLLDPPLRIYRRLCGWRRPEAGSRGSDSTSQVQSVRNWWTERPMVYGNEHGRPVYGGATESAESFALGDRGFFDKVDESLYRWNRPLHNGSPFSRIFPYEAQKGNRVLEVGCGMGSMAMNWAINGARITPVDLTRTAVAQTRRRFGLYDIDRTPCQAQAERLPFPDATFDYAYSWGVLHHTPNTRETLREIHRVIKPGTRIGVMLYSRQSILYRFWVRFYEGFIHREARFLDPVALASRYGDGAREEGNPHTWPVTRREIEHQLFTDFDRVRVRTLGTELDNIFKRAMPGLGHVLPRFIKKAYARRWGWSLWIEAEKSGEGGAR